MNQQSKLANAAYLESDTDVHNVSSLEPVKVAMVGFEPTQRVCGWFTATWTLQGTSIAIKMGREDQLPVNRRRSVLPKVRMRGVEPLRELPQRILSPPRLPVPATLAYKRVFKVVIPYPTDGSL